MDAARHTPSCQGPLSCTFWAVGHLAGSALYVLEQEQKAQGLWMIFAHGAACSPGNFTRSSRVRELPSGSPAGFKLCVFIEIKNVMGCCLVFFFFLTYLMDDGRNAFETLLKIC